MEDSNRTVFLKELTADITTYCSLEFLDFLCEQASRLPTGARVLMTGVGLGAEVVALHRYAKDAQITVIDDWDFTFKDPYYSTETMVANTRENFENYMRKYEVPCTVIETNFFNDKRVIGDWNLIYYDCSNGTYPNEKRKFLSAMQAVWKKCSSGSIILGKSYFFEQPEKKMTPLVDELSDLLGCKVEANHFIADRPWIIRKG